MPSCHANETSRRVYASKVGQREAEPCGSNQHCKRTPPRSWNDPRSLERTVASITMIQRPQCSVASRSGSEQPPYRKEIFHVHTHSLYRRIDKRAHTHTCRSLACVFMLRPAPPVKQHDRNGTVPDKRWATPCTWPRQQRNETGMTSSHHIMLQ